MSPLEQRPRPSGETPPTVTAPSDIVTIANSAGGAVGLDLGTPAVSDNDDPHPRVTNDAPGVFPLGTTTVTWTATDFFGNSATDGQLVTVEPVHVGIDVKPGSFPNSVQHKKRDEDSSGHPVDCDVQCPVRCRSNFLDIWQDRQ